jgi:hypothetical protein
MASIVHGKRKRSAVLFKLARVSPLKELLKIRMYDGPWELSNVVL